MGTNYYHVTDEVVDRKPCEQCGHNRETVAMRRHIGKSSGGWCFSLHIYPEDGIADLHDWRERWRVGVIVDECGERLSGDEMLAIIRDRRWSAKRAPDFDYYGNVAQDGPNGLLRFRIGIGCVGHGEGTWDLVEGDFS